MTQYDSTPVGLEAVCDLGEGTDQQQHFDVAERVVLADGRHVLLHHERGFAVSGPVPVRDHVTAESVVRDVLTTVLPDGPDDPEPHPWSWLADLAAAAGVLATTDELRALPYDVVLTDRVQAWLSDGGASDGGAPDRGQADARTS